MANSCIPGALGQGGHWIWPRTPGPLGFNDQGDPNLCTRLGDTPGSLGLFDWGDPSLPRLSGSHGLLGGLMCRAGDGTPLSLATGGATAAAASSGQQSVTVEAMKALAPNADEAYLRQMADELNTDLATYGLNTPLRRAHFFAQVLEEAGPELKGQIENLNYSPEALKSKFSYYQGKGDEATTDGYEKDSKTKKITRKADPETIANKIYADRLGNGNQASGDGWRFRGRGFIQVTGRANYKSVTEQYKKLYVGDDLDFEKTPEKLADFPYNLRSAVCFWVKNNLHTKSDAGSNDADVNAITAVVNKNTDSYADRRSNFATTWAAFKD
jgi:putative chitinase